MKDRGLLNKVATNLPFVTNIVVEMHNKAKHACTKNILKYFTDWIGVWELQLILETSEMRGDCNIEGKSKHLYNTFEVLTL